ncbi:MULTISPECIES: flavin reductase family protein [Miniimonas]|nr:MULTISPECIES: flavin reductase family protein [Miniimonas]
MTLEDTYRAAMARLPGGVAVVTARAGSRDIAAVVTSLVSVSLEPPTVLVVVHADGRLGDLLVPGGRWAATVVGEHQAAQVAWIAEPGRPDVGQLQGIPHRRGEHSGAALLDGAAWLELRTTQTMEVADHRVVVGEVLAAGLGSETGALVHRLGRVRAVGSSQLGDNRLPGSAQP